jgi:hypothetical protein
LRQYVVHRAGSQKISRAIVQGLRPPKHREKLNRNRKPLGLEQSQRIRRQQGEARVADKIDGSNSHALDHVYSRNITRL